MKEWTQAGFTQKQAQAFVAFRQLGLVPEGLKAVDLPKPINALFSASTEADDPDRAECGRLSAERFATPDQRLSAMNSTGGRWKHFSEAVAGVQPTNRAPILDAGYALVCH
jgi:hypothetical protein